jgi:hypothetical protein
MRAGQGAPPERRLEILEQNVKRFEDEFDAEIRDLSSKIGPAEEGVRKEADERTRTDDRVTRMIEEATIGGLNLEVVGLLWLMLGVLGQGCSDEIAKLLVLMSLARP